MRIRLDERRAFARVGAKVVGNYQAQKAAPHGVRVLSLTTGTVKTPINESVWSHPGSLHGGTTDYPEVAHGG